VAGSSGAFTILIPYILYLPLTIKKGNNSIIRLWQSSAVATLFVFSTIHFAKQFELHEVAMMDKYLVGKSDEELKQFNIDKWREGLRNTEKRDKVDIKEKWGGK